ncbi:MAG: RluA family pseudouridine synthase [Sphingomonadaceae bacterium]|nr:RluA family pseudouridine synthase [Sphingomonadaceae bacterium]
MSTFHAEIPAEADGWRLDRALAAAVPDLSREALKRLISAGNVRNSDDDLVRDVKTPASAGAAFTIDVPEPVPAEAQAQDIPLNIVFEDDHLIVIDKPAGLVVHPAAGNPDGTLVNALLHHCKGQLSGIGGVARPGIVHRIDKGTSGLIVAAKSDRAHEGLSKQFAVHSISRVYKALASDILKKSEGSIVTNLARSSNNRQKMAVVEPPRGKHAVTHYRRIEALNEATLVECRLETGRTHQVRVHMAHIGHSLLGDPFYGRPKKVHRPLLERLDFRRQALHAAELGFDHPVTRNAMHFHSELPSDIQELYRLLNV